MRIKLTSIMVDDQEKTLQFYTEVLGFRKKHDIPVAAFQTSDIAADYARLSSAGVAFTTRPVPAGPVMIAVFADTCGNLIQLHQPV